jgi:hypothetical protein
LITELRPGTSPPPVRTPMRFFAMTISQSMRLERIAIQPDRDAS